MKEHGAIKHIANSAGTDELDKKWMIKDPGFKKTIKLILDSFSLREIQTWSILKDNYGVS